jgi:hypothetical protein
LIKLATRVDKLISLGIPAATAVDRVWMENPNAPTTVLNALFRNFIR